MLQSSPGRVEGWQGLKKCHDEMKSGNNTQLSGTVAGWNCYALTVDFVQKILNAPELHWQCGGVAGPPKVP